MKKIIGKNYLPYDNSFCINCRNGRRAMLVQRSPTDNEYIGPDPEEENATFEIVTNPYKEEIIFIGRFYIEEFINVKSSKTGNIYRTLYINKRVL